MLAAYPVPRRIPTRGPRLIIHAPPAAFRSEIPARQPALRSDGLQPIGNLMPLVLARYMPGHEAERIPVAGASG